MKSIFFWIVLALGPLGLLGSICHRDHGGVADCSDRIAYSKPSFQPVLGNVKESSIQGGKPTTRVILTSDYDKEELPPQKNGGPVLVNVSVNLNSIIAINEPQQKVTLETTIRLTWFDTRISVNLSKDQDYLMINRNPTLDIWFPDVYLSKVQDLRVPTYVIEPRYLKITKDRRLTYSARVNYDFACPMNFKYYPVDVQRCPIVLESWGNTIDQLKFDWNVEDSNIYTEYSLNQHAFKHCFRKAQAIPYGHGQAGTYSVLELMLIFEREITYHLLRTYLPSILFVFVAWFSMFVPLNHVPGRVAMSMTTMLTLSAMFGSLTSITPPISYTTRLDQWMIACIVFVFATLMEFTTVIFLKYYLQYLPIYQLPKFLTGDRSNNSAKDDNIKKKAPVSKADQVWMIKQKSPQDDDDEDSEYEEEVIAERQEFGNKVIKKIEKYSVLVFFLSFVIFNVVYWVDIISVLNREINNTKFSDCEEKRIPRSSQ